MPGTFGPLDKFEKTVTVQNELKYHLVSDIVDRLEYIEIDGSDLSNDIHIGLSKFSGHADRKWEIIIGGWGGTQSVIRLRDGSSVLQPVARQHSKTFYNSIRGNIRVSVNDGEFMIRANGEDFFTHKDDSIKKSELKYLLLSGGWGGQGTYKVVGTPIKGDAVITQAPTINSR